MRGRSIAVPSPLPCLLVVPLTLSLARASPAGVNTTYANNDANIVYVPNLSAYDSPWSIGRIVTTDGQTVVASTAGTNASAYFSFKGFAVYLNFVIGPTTANVSLTLDGEHHFSDYVHPSVLTPATIFAFEGLDPLVQHYLNISKSIILPEVAIESPSPNDLNTTLMLDSIIVTTYPIDQSGIPAGAAATITPSASLAGRHRISSGVIAASVISSVFASFLFLIVLFCWLRRRPKRVRPMPPSHQLDPLLISAPPPTPQLPRINIPRHAQFRTENLPHFVAPPSVWHPSSISHDPDTAEQHATANPAPQRRDATQLVREFLAANLAFPPVIPSPPRSDELTSEAPMPAIPTAPAAGRAPRRRSRARQTVFFTTNPSTVTESSSSSDPRPQPSLPSSPVPSIRVPTPPGHVPTPLAPVRRPVTPPLPPGVIPRPSRRTRLKVLLTTNPSSHFGSSEGGPE